ncbi:ATP-binding protein [Paenibacillus sp. FSL R5-0912]|uniref:ATP-binding protein n=1 Tax=Paenibacillus sp. FSL R5-0912 TaxID=1536771 RepID=UPI0007C7E479|nr:ATP-binding protein [Paenibacillus sp. FSL R5-0912]
MAEYKLKVSGNAIGELSEKIPSNIIALNELIKNAYDAGANSVSINLDTSKQIMTIQDDGKGMNEEDISTLLQISKSTKQYGKLVNNRYIQGSKGLGFLSVFKFGDKVTWKTIKDKERCFSIDYNEILGLDDVSNYNVIIDDVLNGDLRKGTKIEIQLRNSFGVENLKSYLLDQVNRDKILNSFIDNTFEIILEIEGRIYRTKKELSLEKYYEDNKMFRVTYDSDSHEIDIQYFNHSKFGPWNPDKKSIPVDSFTNINRFKLELDLMLYDFTGGKGKTSPDKLFIDPTNTLTEKLTPLIFINKNLFNNYTLFDPEISRYKRAGDSMAQMIGIVQIITDDSELQFNSDRTQFQENELTNDIKNILSAINLFIQKQGSEIKNEIKKRNKKKAEEEKKKAEEEKAAHDHNTYPPENDPPKSDKKEEGTNPENPQDGTSTPSNKLQEPFLNLKERELAFELPLEPINLVDFFEVAEDSYGNSVNFDKIQCEANGLIIENKILIISSSGERDISFGFEDSLSGKVTTSLKIHVLEKIAEPLETKKTDRILIPNEAKSGYKIKFQNTPINDLVDQLNRLFKNTRTSYIEVIACSLRSVFELSVYEWEMSGKVTYVFKKSSSDRLMDKVVTLIKAIIENDYLVGEISKGLGLPSYRDFKNVLTAKDYESTIKKSHLGAHKSTKSLSEKNLEDIGKDVGLFLVIINELLNNTVIDWRRIGSPWQLEV